MTDTEPFVHPCQAPGCTEDGSFGEGVRLLKGREGTWWCHEHWVIRKAEIEAAKNQRIEPTLATDRQGSLLDKA